jgi:HSP20 family protein
MTQGLSRQTNEGKMATRGEHPLTRIQRDFDRLFNRAFGGWMTPFEHWLTPFEREAGSMRLWDFDVQDNDREISVRAELPGFEDKELDVQLSDNVLTIKAEKQQKDERQEEYRSFYRSITLPQGVDADKVQASYRNGVLELHIPRSESARPRHITVQGEQPGDGAKR